MAAVTAPQLTRCPVCSGELRPLGVAIGVQCTSCSWEGSGFETLKAPEPKLKFRVEWSESDPENTGFIYVGSLIKIAELFWNGGEWIFIPCDQDGEVISYVSAELRHIDVDPERRLHLNRIEEANTLDRLDRNETVQAAMDAALMTRRREFRDDSRELAELGARIFARGWYSKWREL